ncbi:hypothetical protein PspLS_03612 [Pyricularia sp. CBS 133598]|nr:hypothetical protein PspLS_03612 [Pyricularia sp. CBS 133598]
MSTEPAPAPVGRAYFAATPELEDDCPLVSFAQAIKLKVQRVLPTPPWQWNEESRSAKSKDDVFVLDENKTPATAFKLDLQTIKALRSPSDQRNELEKWAKTRESIVFPGDTSLKSGEPGYPKFIRFPNLTKLNHHLKPLITKERIEALTQPNGHCTVMEKYILSLMDRNERIDLVNQLSIPQLTSLVFKLFTMETEVIGSSKKRKRDMQQTQEEDDTPSKLRHPRWDKLNESPTDSNVIDSPLATVLASDETWVTLVPVKMAQNMQRELQKIIDEIKPRTTPTNPPPLLEYITKGPAETHNTYSTLIQENNDLKEKLDISAQTIELLSAEIVRQRSREIEKAAIERIKNALATFVQSVSTNLAVLNQKPV